MMGVCADGDSWRGALALRPMKKIRVLVVDDSAVIRRLIVDLFAGEPEIEAVGTAANGRAALQKIPQLNPDLVTLDVEMPEMDGLETVRAIREKWPQLPVIMFSSLTERGAATTLEALRLGASDYVAKPSGANGAEGLLEQLRAELIPKIKALCNLASQEAVVAPPKIAVRSQAAQRPGSRVRIVAIGISTGGPSALHSLIPNFPENFPVPIVIVQHMPAVFTRLLAEQISKHSALKVHEGAAGATLMPGHAWIAPGGHHMALQRRGTAVQIAINEEPAGKFLPAGGGRAVPFGCGMFWARYAGGDHDRHGERRHGRLRKDSQGGRADYCSGSGTVRWFGECREAWWRPGWRIRLWRSISCREKSAGGWG